MLPLNGELTTFFDPKHPWQGGEIGRKFMWWRTIEGQLTVSGRRLDAPAPPLRAEVPAGYGSTGFQPIGLFFASEGCWEVVGRVAGSDLRFVVWVPRPVELQ
jgi:hypothetical protein